MTTIRGFVYLEDEAAFDVQAETFRVGEERFRLETILRGLSGGNGEQGPQGPQGATGPQGPQGPQGPIDQTLAERIDAIYLAGQSAPTNGNYSGGVLHWTGGTIASPFGPINGVSLTLPASTTISIAANLATLTGNQAFIALWHHMASASDALADHLSTRLGLAVQVVANTSSVMSDDVSAGTLADTEQGNIRLVGKHLVFEIAGEPNATFQTAETSLAQPDYLHIFVVDPGNGMVPDATIGFDGPITTATGLLPDEIAARISGDAALASGLAAVQSLAETNQLNINTKTDQTDFDSLAEIVTDNGLLLASRASQSDLDTLATEVSTKATPADISAAIAALVDGAPASLDTLAEIAAALAGDQASIADLLTQINNRVRFDAAQSLTTAQQLQARQNINAEAVGVAAALIAAITAASIGAATAAQGSKADSALQSGDVAPVALSGSYTALTDKPTIVNPVNADWNSNSGLSQILNKPTLFGLSSLLTGLGAGANTVIAATDTLINALAKLQAQISTNATSASTNAANISSNSAALAPVPKKLGSSWYKLGRWYDATFPLPTLSAAITYSAGYVHLTDFTALETVTIQNIGINVTTAGTAGSTAIFAIYASNSYAPAALLWQSATIAVDSTGAKSTACGFQLQTGTGYYLAMLSSANISAYGIVRCGTGYFAQSSASTYYRVTGTTIPANASAATEISSYAPRIMIQAQ